MHLASVVIPSYNHEQFISESIESVLGQSVDDLELIIVDDASTDASRQIIESYTSRDPRIKVFLHETNMGVARTLNDGIEMATGRFICFLSSGDVWVEDKLRKQHAIFKHDENLVVVSDAEVMDSQGRLFGKKASELNNATEIYNALSRRGNGVIIQSSWKRSASMGQR